MQTILLWLVNLAALYFLVPTIWNTARWLTLADRELLWTRPEISELTSAYASSVLVLGSLIALGVWTRQWGWPLIGVAYQLLVFNRRINRMMAQLAARNGQIIAPPSS